MTTLLIPHPDDTTWETWAQTVVGYNPVLINQLSWTLPWEEFGERLSLVVPEAPRTDTFDSWQAWASALKLAVPG